ncbi:MAG: chromosome segregation protein SMC [Bacteroidia bacterium]|nr:chromosome segregation protein SMC [Bacteroidia bacterium]
MRLVSLEIQGFKSFADRVKLRFVEGVTGVVGPNGCGKSNVVDAIRWVLGEQRTRNLRSDKMENVLFNGTDKRKRAAMAEVVITFENHRGILPTEFSTVSITRRLYQGGESEYLLNGVSCRLKDITNLLLDTGIGPDSYAIIELGMVEDLLTDKQNARRALFEEAAGIGKYKLRKKETFARLGETQQSLERVEDLLHEIEQNLKTLEKQAKKAQEYTQLKEAYRQASTQQASLQYSALGAELEVLGSELAGYETQLASLSAQIAALDSELAAQGKTILSEEQAVAALTRNLATLSDRIKTRENEHALKNERARYLTDRRSALETALASEAEQHAAHEARRLAFERQLAEADQALEAQAQAYATAKAQLEALQQQHTEARMAADARREALRADETTQADLERAHERAETQLQALQRELQRSQQEREAGAEQQASYGGRIEALRAEMALAEAKITELAQALDTHQQALAEAAAGVETTREARFAAQRALDAKQQEFQLLEGLVQSLEGFSESVRWLKQTAAWAHHLPLVPDLFAAPPELRVALEAVLDPWLNHLVVPDGATARNAVELLQSAGKGRAQCLVLAELPAPAAAASPPPGTRRLIELLEYAPSSEALAQFLFGRVLVVETPPAAPLEGWQWVTPTGTLVSRTPTLAGGSVGLFEGKRVGRTRALEKLAPEVAALQAALKAAEDTHQAATGAHAALLQANPERPLQEAERNFQLLFRQLASLQAKEDEYQNFLGRLSSRSSDLEAQMSQLRQEQYDRAPQRAEVARRVGEGRTAVAELREAAEAVAKQVAAQQEATSQANIAYITAQNAHQALQRELSYTQQQAQELANLSTRQREELSAIGRELEQLARAGQLHDSTIVELYQERQAAQQVLAGREEALLGLKQANEATATRQRQLRTQVGHLQQQQTGVKDRATALQLQQNSIRDRLLVEFMLDIAALPQATIFPEGAPRPTGAALEAQVLSLREKLARFGPVNTTAVEAYAEIQERHTFITAQRDDLMGARENLLQTIGEMDTTAKAQFEAAFAQIRENFIRVFRTLFTEQDSADLILTQPDDPLESPIDILARPKGKRPLTISQLSGGEKTLTATSLLFAIYLLKPAPFCIFDEVDAPLDDANVDKFTNIIGEFSANSQFIVVTHNKRTMAKTQVLYGVTMEEAGVSRVLPVDLVSLNLN